MAISAQLVEVTTSATLLNSDNQSRVQSVLVSVPSGGSTVYIGGPDVDTTDGFPVPAGASVSIDLSVKDDVYAVVASSTQDVNVLETGV